MSHAYDDGSPAGRAVRSCKVKLDGVQKSHAAQVVRRGAEDAGLIDAATADVARDAAEELFRTLQPGYGW